MQGAPARHLGIADVLERAFALYRAHPLPLLVLAAIPSTIVFAVFGLIFAVFAGDDLARLARLTTPEPDVSVLTPDLVVTIILFALAFVVVSSVVGALQAGALTAAAATADAGDAPGVGACLRTGLRVAPRILLLGIVAFATVIAICAVILVPAIVVAALAQGGVGILVMVVAGVAAVVLIFFAIASWLVAPVIATREGSGPIASLRRSWQLSRGQRWRILGLLLVLSILNAAVGFLLSLLAGTPFADDVTSGVVRQLGNLIASVLWTPLYWLSATILYRDLSARSAAAA